ncbi:Similar to PREB: Prolactin regulatory element-binding protein (Homo sapiens) [Cotesia congregata]|uniref:Similar to PREB: Prolactin regulatory element-binding protein (Homo sapiens) n=1 Tax=Cotesia congregata TaxID=51543 RepID=A0A8J2MJY6_COTCN|nr:Similar to PREB: Prolactin regulatory element-binding protein (Homo sapiens) [Cotesia congregata]
MPSRRNNEGLLARVNFPLYTIQMLTNRHVLVGGGGGSSKTGVANGFEIFELSHDGSNFIAEEVTRHETGPSVVMNCASFNNSKKTWLVAGQESHCQLYNVVPRVVAVENGEVVAGANSNFKENDNSLRQRKLNEKKGNSSSNSNTEKVENIRDSNSNIKHKKLQLILKPSTSIQTDFSEPEPLQRIVRVSSNGKVMATGGLDGVIRLWKFPQFEKMYDLKAHTKEVDDIDFNINGKFVATIAKDNRAFVWNVVEGKKYKELSWVPPNGAKYLFKRLRFKIPNEKKSATQLYMLSNATSSKLPSYLQLWDVDQGIIIKSAPYKETLSAIAVSDDGKFVAVGTMFSGSIDIYIAFSLQKALHVSGAHSMFVTGLEFLPTTLDGPSITSNSETAVVSISVDNRICIHSIPFRHALPFWLVTLLIILSICGAFIFCSYMGI